MQNKYPELALATIHFALIDDSGGNDKNTPDLCTFPNIVILRTPETMGPDKSLVFGLRALRGTIREEDIVVSMDPENILHETYSETIICTILHENYDSRKLVIADDPGERTPSTSITHAGFRGWFAQFLLKRDEFNFGYRFGLYHTKSAARKWLPFPLHRRPIVKEKLSLRRFARWLQRFAFPLVMFTCTIVFLLLLITPSYAWSLLF